MAPLDPALVRRHGYRGHIATKASAASNPETATKVYLQTLDPGDRLRYVQAKDAPRAEPVTVLLPDGQKASASLRGCIARGRAAVYGSVRNFLRMFYLPQGIRAFGQDALTELRVRAALEEYSQCMVTQGFGVRSPSDSSELAQQRFGGRSGPPSRAEIKMAFRDARCQERSAFLDVLDEALLETAAAWLQGNEAELQLLAELQRDSEDRAREILSRWRKNRLNNTR